MYCPKCGAEYGEGLNECADCQLALVPDPPTLSAEIDEPLQEVFRTGDRALLPVVESVLGSAGIPYSISGDEAMALLPVTTARQLTVILRVPEHLADEAKALIEELPEGVAEDSEGEVEQ